MTVFSQMMPESTQQPVRVLKVNWEAEDRAFRVSLATFRQAIEFVNPVVPPRAVKEAIGQNPKSIIGQNSTQKISPPQTQAPQGDEKKLKENSPEPKGLTDLPVESINVETSIGVSTLLPSLAPKESAVPISDDLLDEILQPNQKTPPPTKKAPAPAAKTEACPFDDFLAPVTAGLKDPLDVSPPPPEKSSAPSPQAKPAQPEPKAESKPEPEEDPAPFDVDLPKEKPMLQPAQTGCKRALPMALLDGFDFEKFADVQAQIDRSLRNCPEIDLDALRNTMKDYAVELHLDHYRENPRIIDQKMAEVKDKQDSIQSVRRRMIPIISKLGLAVLVAEKSGSMCSIASSADKRLAQVRIVCEDLFARYSDAKSLLELADLEYEHLQSQYDACSRLVTFYTSIHRGELPASLPPVEKQPQAETKQATTAILNNTQPTPVPEAPPPSAAGKEVAPKVKRPIADLEDFPKAPEQLMPKAETKTKGSRVVEF